MGRACARDDNMAKGSAPGEHHSGAVMPPWLQEGGGVSGGPEGWPSFYSGGRRKTDKRAKGMVPPKWGSGGGAELGENTEELECVEQRTVKEREEWKYV